MQFRGSLDGVQILFLVRDGWVGGATAYLRGATASLVGGLEVPLLIWWVGGKMKSRIRVTSAKVGVEVEAGLGNKAISSSNLKLKLNWSMAIL